MEEIQVTNLTFQFTPSERICSSIAFTDAVDSRQVSIQSDDRITVNLDGNTTLSIVFGTHIRYSVPLNDSMSAISVLRESITAIEKYIDTPVDHFNVSLIFGGSRTNQTYQDLYEDIISLEKELSSKNHNPKKLSSGNIHINFPLQESVIAA